MTDYQTYVFVQTIILLVVVLGFWTLASWFYKNSAMRANMLQTRYIDLYELYKVNEELKERGLDFKQLDKFELDIVGHKKTAIQRIDEKYKKERKEIKRGK